MPNWITTVVQFGGDDKDIQAVLKEISSDETKFDFNKLIPMPETLRTDGGGYSDIAYAYYYAKKFKRLPDNEHHLKTPQEAIERVERDINISSQEMFDKGKVLHENKEKYGATDWYDWSIANWGTKWNSHEVRIYNDDGLMEFQTAWGFAAPVMEKLAELCAKHNVSFEGEWADEDMGSNTGCFSTLGEDGGFAYDYHADCSSEAYAAYERCCGASDCIGVDENGNYYRHECNDSCPNYKECTGW